MCVCVNVCVCVCVCECVWVCVFFMELGKTSDFFPMTRFYKIHALCLSRPYERNVFGIIQINLPQFRVLIRASHATALTLSSKFLLKRSPPTFFEKVFLILPSKHKILSKCPYSILGCFCKSFTFHHLTLLIFQISIFPPAYIP